jgi:hypothetical protein
MAQWRRLKVELHHIIVTLIANRETTPQTFQRGAGDQRCCGFPTALM